MNDRTEELARRVRNALGEFDDPNMPVVELVRDMAACLRKYDTAPKPEAQGVGEDALIALVAGPYMWHHKMNELQERYAQGFDRCRELTIERIKLYCETRRAMQAALSTPASHDAQQPSSDCWCETCKPNTLADMRMVLCPDCGNKRCPKATDHRNACTNSNEPGQKGSTYDLAGVESMRQELAQQPAVVGDGATAWKSIDLLPDSDDLFWFLRWDSVGGFTEDGPRPPQRGGYDADEWTWFAPAESPPFAALTPAATPGERTDSAGFKNFHRSLCARFGYTHDGQFWWRDLVSLEEHIAKLVAQKEGNGNG